MLAVAQASMSSARFNSISITHTRLEELVASTVEAFDRYRRNRPRRTSLSGARFGSHEASPANAIGARFDSKSAGVGAGASPLDSLSYKSARAEIDRRREEFAQQWRACVLDSNAELTADALTETARPVFEALLELGDWAVDLSGLSAERVNGVHLAVILRATLRHKSTTKGWEEALNVAREAVIRMGLPERKVLSGLIKK
jgi:hypothetical protein